MNHTYQKRLKQRCEQRGIRLSATQLEGLSCYVEILLQWRRAINLTGLRQADQIIDVLVGESLDFLQRRVLPYGAQVLDLGTGAGVPGVSLAICAPDVQVTLLDRSEKKITFLRHLVARLQLCNCQPLCESAEALARRLPPDQRFDVVVARGVGRVAAMLCLAAPLLKAGGRLLLRKPQGTPELPEAAACLASDTWTEVDTLPVSPHAKTSWVLLVLTRGGC